MKNIIKKIGKILGVSNLALLMLVSPVLATEWTVTDEDFTNKAGAGADIIGELAAFVKPISGILIFISVLIVGFEIIMKRNKADERMESMSSLMWVGIGALVIGIAGMIASFLFQMNA